MSTFIGPARPSRFGDRGHRPPRVRSSTDRCQPVHPRRSRAFATNTHPRAGTMVGRPRAARANDPPHWGPAESSAGARWQKQGPLAPPVGRSTTPAPRKWVAVVLDGRCCAKPWASDNIRWAEGFCCAGARQWRRAGVTTTPCGICAGAPSARWRPPEERPTRAAEFRPALTAGTEGKWGLPQLATLGRFGPHSGSSRRSRRR